MLSQHLRENRRTDNGLYDGSSTYCTRGYCTGTPGETGVVRKGKQGRDGRHVVGDGVHPGVIAEGPRGRLRKSDAARSMHPHSAQHWAATEDKTDSREWKISFAHVTSESDYPPV